MELEFKDWADSLVSGDLDAMAVFGDLCFQNEFETMGMVLVGYASGALTLEECKQEYFKEVNHFTPNERIEILFKYNLPIPYEIVIPHTTMVHRILALNSFQFINTLGFFNFTRRLKLKASVIDSLKELRVIKIHSYPFGAEPYPYWVGHPTIRGIMDENA